MPESPHKFNLQLDNDLSDLKFTACKADPYMYTKRTKDGIVIESVRIDNILVSSPSKADQKWFEECMSTKFLACTSIRLPVILRDEYHT